MEDAYDDQGRACGPRRNGGEYGSEEETEEEADSGDDGSQAGLAALGDTSATLDESGHGRTAKESTDRNGEGVGTVCDCRAWKVASVWVDDTGKASH